MSSETAIRVTGLGKCFHIYDKPRDRLLQMLMRGRKRYFREFWALQDINFEVKRGESIGIVGRNGSGKSTLLQLICGTLTPTTGSIETFGRIAALLELGSGFNPEFTGRENVYLNASVLGLTPAEIDERFDSIAAFADIGSFLEQPVKTYSSGMAVRLAFAVQAQVNPDILIVDEALAVGDARFQAKCFERLRQLKENGTSILLVTHSGEQVVTHCTRAILLDAHRIQELGAPRTVVNRYMDLLFGRDRTKPTSGGDTTDSQNTDNIDTAAPVNPPSELNFDEDVYATRPLYNAHEYRWGDGAAHITDFSLTSNGRPITHPVKSGTPIQLDIAIRFYGTVVAPILGFTLKTKEGVTVAGSNTDISGENNFRELGDQGTTAHVRLRFTLRLTGGDYFISLGIASHQSEHLVPHDRRYDSIHLVVEPTEKFYGLTDLSVELATNPA